MRLQDLGLAFLIGCGLTVWQLGLYWLGYHKGKQHGHETKHLREQ